MNKLILFIGGSGTGKTTTEQELVSSGFAKSIVSHTSRKKREGEIEGIHYYFSDVDSIKKLDKANEIKITEDWYYSVSRTELLKDYPNLIYSVINIKPAFDIIKYVEKHNLPLEIVIIFFNVSKEIRIKKMIERGEKEESVLIRLNREDNLEDFSKYNLVPDYIEDTIDINMTNRIKEFLCQKKI